MAIDSSLGNFSTEAIKDELQRREVTITFQRAEIDLLMRLVKEPLLQFVEAQKGKPQDERPAGLYGLMQRLVLALTNREEASKNFDEFVASLKK
jgi:hypothetical protein